MITRAFPLLRPTSALLTSLLETRFPSSSVTVLDASGGCGDFFNVEVAWGGFKGVTVVDRNRCAFVFVFVFVFRLLLLLLLLACFSLSTSPKPHPRAANERTNNQNG